MPSSFQCGLCQSKQRDVVAHFQQEEVKPSTFLVFLAPRNLPANGNADLDPGFLPSVPHCRRFSFLEEHADLFLLSTTALYLLALPSFSDSHTELFLLALILRPFFFRRLSAELTFMPEHRLGSLRPGASQNPLCKKLFSFNSEIPHSSPHSPRFLLRPQICLTQRGAVAEAKRFGRIGPAPSEFRGDILLAFRQSP